MASRYWNQILKIDEDLWHSEAISAFVRHWRLLLIGGMALLVLAFVSFFLSLISAIQLSQSLAVIFLAAGVIYLSQALGLRQEQGSLIRLLQAALSLVIGGILYRSSGSGMMGISMGLTVYFLIGSILSWTFYSEILPGTQSSWGLLSALTSLIFGLSIALLFPLARLWLPGTLLGIELLISGSGMIGFALSVRKHQAVPHLKPDSTTNDFQIELLHNKHFHT